MYKSHRRNGHKQLLSLLLSGCFVAVAHFGFRLLKSASHNIYRIMCNAHRLCITQHLSIRYILVRTTCFFTRLIFETSRARFHCCFHFFLLSRSVASPLRTAIFLYIESNGHFVSIRKFRIDLVVFIKMKLFHTQTYEWASAPTHGGVKLVYGPIDRMEGIKQNSQIDTISHHNLYVLIERSIGLWAQRTYKTHTEKSVFTRDR